MKIAVAGKGGAGKTTLCGGLVRELARQGLRVLALDADPDANLASVLPLDQPQPIVPLAARRDLIGSLAGGSDLPSGFFVLNPEVDTVLPELRVTWGGGHGLIVLGWHKGGGAGCYCAENAVMKRVFAAVFTGPDDAVVVDSEAGIEHMSRGTIAAADVVLVAVEPGQRSVETAYAVRALARDLGIDTVLPVLCKVQRPRDVDTVQHWLGSWPIAAVLPFSEEVRQADLDGRPPRIEGPFADGLRQITSALGARQRASA